MQKELDTTVTPTPPLSLYNSTLTFTLRLESILDKPHPFSSALLVGMTRQIEPILLLLAACEGYTLQRPSQIAPTEKGLESFKASLKKIYTKAGVRVRND